jgi:stromal membrane-associated protein
VEKRWALQGELQSSKSAEIPVDFKVSQTTGAKNGIQKNRRLSLEESILVNHMAQIRPPIPKFQEVFMFYFMFNPSRFSFHIFICTSVVK